MDCNIVYQVGSVQKNVVTQHSPNFLDAGPNLQFDQHDRVWNTGFQHTPL